MGKESAGAGYRQTQGAQMCRELATVSTTQSMAPLSNIAAQSLQKVAFFNKRQGMLSGIFSAVCNEFTLSITFQLRSLFKKIWWNHKSKDAVTFARSDTDVESNCHRGSVAKVKVLEGNGCWQFIHCS